MSPVFDPAVLDRLTAQARGHGDESLVRELVVDSVASIAHCAAELEEAIGSGDLGRIRTHAHRMKSVLRQVGGLRMGEALARAESLAAANDRSALDAARDALGHRVETVAALEAHARSLG